MPLVCPVGNVRNLERQPATFKDAAVPDLRAVLGLENGEEAPAEAPPGLDLRIKVAGFGGQGVLMLGELLAEAGLEAGYDVSWLPSYGPEMRSGTSNCHVRITRREIDSPLVSRPNVLLALNEPSLSKFLPAVEPGGVILYNGRDLPDGYTRDDVRIAAIPATEIADALGSGKATNIVILGALLEMVELVAEERIVDALRRLVKNEKLLELDL